MLVWTLHLIRKAERKMKVAGCPPCQTTSRVAAWLFKPLHNVYLLTMYAQMYCTCGTDNPKEVGIHRVCQQREDQMVNGLHSYSAYLTSGHLKRFAKWPHIHPFNHTFTQRQR